ncbi:hypothetical protein [Clostridium estertheticum]|nr:hypothetical protein [Clostridium estertheticum]
MDKSIRTDTIDSYNLPTRQNEFVDYILAVKYTKKMYLSQICLS